MPEEKFARVRRADSQGVVSRGITMVLDRLSGLVKEEFEQVSDSVDIVEIGWGLPLVWKEDAIASRIKFYTKHGIRVSMSGTLLEYSVFQNHTESILSKAKRMGFSIIEISDGIIDLTVEQKVKLAKLVKSKGFEYLVAVGKKDPSAQLSLPETISQIDSALSLDPFKVVLEGRERGRGVGIYDDNGDIKWSMLRSIAKSFDYKNIIFEAPSEAQQTALISEFGSDVNLGNVALGSIAALQSERRGLRFDTFGINRPDEELVGGPSLKFVLFVVRHYQPIDQKEIASLTQLPRRTVQKAVEYLKSKQLITEHPSFEDRRSKVYRTPSATPIGRARH
ncbi:MAG TPA: phosphosulfolactate synthase [Nitrososphaerales archaeon]|nr:phosphosulfolactate synthase [Nitrososphaerales archaeon]